jgi:hypothetical protein
MQGQALQALLRLLQGNPNTNYRSLGPPKPNTWNDPTTWNPPPRGPGVSWGANSPVVPGDPMTNLLQGLGQSITGAGTPLAPGPPQGSLSGRVF